MASRVRRVLRDLAAIFRPESRAARLEMAFAHADQRYKQEVLAKMQEPPEKPKKAWKQLGRLYLYFLHSLWDNKVVLWLAYRAFSKETALLVLLLYHCRKLVFSLVAALFLHILSGPFSQSPCFARLAMLELMLRVLVALFAVILYNLRQLHSDHKPKKNRLLKPNNFWKEKNLKGNSWQALLALNHNQ